MTPKDKYDASPSATGYLFQCRFALLEALRQLREQPALEISLERFDDVSIDAGVAGRVWIQTKHHRGRTGRLTDASVDLWGTLRIWSERLATGQLTLPETRLWIVTTAVAPAGSAAEMLRHDGRKPMDAVKALLKVASKSRSKENADAYAAFLKLPNAARLKLIESVRIFDGTPTIEDVPRMLAQELWSAVAAEHRVPFVQRLEGWWFDRVAAHLGGTRQDPITALEIQAFVDDLREQFARDNLPIDSDLPRSPQSVSDKDEQRPLVAQLRLLDATDQRILFALHDYHRAYAQTSRWVREGLLRPGELENYHESLKHEWARRFDIRVASLKAGATEEERRRVGNVLYEQVIEEFKLHIRERCDKPFVMRGTYHELADDLEVGWHPDFDARLRVLFGLTERSA